MASSASSSASVSSCPSPAANPRELQPLRLLQLILGIFRAAQSRSQALALDSNAQRGGSLADARRRDSMPPRIFANACAASEYSVPHSLLTRSKSVMASAAFDFSSAFLTALKPPQPVRLTQSLAQRHESRRPRRVSVISNLENQG